MAVIHKQWASGQVHDPAQIASASSTETVEVVGTVRRRCGGAQRKVGVAAGRAGQRRSWRHRPRAGNGERISRGSRERPARLCSLGGTITRIGHADAPGPAWKQSAFVDMIMPAAKSDVERSPADEARTGCEAPPVERSPLSTADTVLY
jgi:hypothetical protein